LIEMRYFLINLLPHSPKTQIPTHLKYSEVLFYIQLTINTLSKSLELFFIKEEMDKFDPHVGETSCQIRAYQVMYLKRMLKKIKKDHIEERMNYLYNLADNISSDLNKFKMTETQKRDKNASLVTLEYFLNHSNYNFRIFSYEFFLVQAYLLTHYKTH